MAFPSIQTNTSSIKPSLPHFDVQYLLTLNQHASVFPWLATGLASEIKIDPMPCWEDSPQLAAGYASIFFQFTLTPNTRLHFYQDHTLTKEGPGAI